MCSTSIRALAPGPGASAAGPVANVSSAPAVLALPTHAPPPRPRPLRHPDRLELLRRNFQQNKLLKDIGPGAAGEGRITAAIIGANAALLQS